MNKIIAVAVMISLLLAGCASSGRSRWYDDWKLCALAGGVVGGAAGAIDKKDHALPGAAAGALIGALICQVAKPGDADGDGVPDDRDRCPNTPKGVKVDAQGCPIDSDGDGVADYLDRCPDTPQGVKVDARGCPLDRDADGVPDDLDKCPDTPKGVTVDAQGCPLDSDGDGIPDYKDKCPGTPPGKRVDADGCVLPEVIHLKGVNFEYNSADLSDDSKAVLDDAVAILKRYPDMKVEVAGHTDSRGTPHYNEGLSQRRAAAVMKYLVSKGANAENLTAKGYGQTEPIADNATDEGRAMNRRVELRTK